MNAMRQIAIAVAILVLVVGLGGGVWAMTREDGHDMAGMNGGQTPAESGTTAGGHDMAEMGAAEGVPFDQAFIDNMVPHHEAAVEMARFVRENGERPELEGLAEEIVLAQQGEIAEMKEWRRTWYGSDETPSEMSMEMPGMDVEALESADDPDLAFIVAMIPHHESAIEMAEEAQDKAEHAEIKALADDIITAQQAEIDQLERWRTEWYGEER